jgi:UDP-N-acetylglucosamine:LPS N-acetylglucosamine transferase
LDPAVFTLFLQGGAKGSAGVNSTIEYLLSAHVPIQIILAVGNNTRMAARYAGRKEIRTISFTESIAPYMAGADVIAGKAGASFISEAFMLEKPFLATTYIPGQETANQHFLQQHNLGWVYLQSSAQKDLLTRLANNPALLAEKLESIRAYKAWNIQANSHIRPIIAQLLS